MGKFEVYGKDAERLYVQRNKTLTEIGGLCGISLQTLSRWKQEGGWEEKKRAYLSSPRGAVEVIEEVLLRKVEEIRKIHAEDVTSGQIDGLSKLVSMIEKMRRESDPLGQAIAVFEEFSQFVKGREKDPRKVGWLYAQMQGFFDRIKEG